MYLLILLVDSLEWDVCDWSPVLQCASMGWKCGDVTCRCQRECTDKREGRSSEQLQYLELRWGTRVVLQFNARRSHTTSWQGWRVIIFNYPALPSGGFRNWRKGGANGGFGGQGQSPRWGSGCETPKKLKPKNALDASRKRSGDVKC